MCINVRKRCECGKEDVQFHLRDNILIPAVILKLYCPDCPGHESYNPDTMFNDNGWIIEYDMMLAKTMVSQKLGHEPDQVMPALLFDQGYGCWQELYPGEKEDMSQEKAEIQKLAKIDQKKYLTTIQKWNIDRIDRLRRQGWRRVQ